MDNDSPDIVNDEQIATNRLFDILSDRRRRYALYYLDQLQTPLLLADLADEIAKHEHGDQPLTTRPQQEASQINLELHHIHIPKMADANLIDYDPDQSTVALNYNLAELNLEQFLD